MTSSTRTGTGDVSAEKAKISQAVIDSFFASINGSVTRLQMRGCQTIYSTPPTEQPAAGSKECHLFHKDGGEVIYQDSGYNNCALSGGNLLTLSAGQLCGNMIYAGSSTGRRLYVINSDLGYMRWSGASSSSVPTTGNDGPGNTDALVATGGYIAAASCRLLGPKWYLPSMNELQSLYAVAHTGEFNTLFPAHLS